MIAFKRSGRGFQVKVSEPGTGMRGYSLHCLDLSECQASLMHYYGLPGHPSEAEANCPFCRAIAKDSNMKMRVSTREVTL